MVVHAEAFAETWIWNAVAYAASQVRITWQTSAVPPRSICSHCGSAKALDHRVDVLPSTAAEAGVGAFSVEEAVALRPCAAFAVTHAAAAEPPRTWAPAEGLSMI